MNSYNGKPRILASDSEIRAQLAHQELEQRKLVEQMRMQRAIARLEFAAGYVPCPTCKGQVPVTMTQSVKGLHITFGCDTCHGFGSVKPEVVPIVATIQT